MCHVSHNPTRHQNDRVLARLMFKRGSAYDEVVLEVGRISVYQNLHCNFGSREGIVAN